jgi:hypothetical protein
MAEQKYTAQQRAALFAQMTRQNLHMLPGQAVTSAPQSVQFVLPKARYLSNIFLNVSAKVKVTHASATTITVPTFAPYQLIRRVSVDLNNGFSPFIIGGKDLAVYNLDRLNPDIVIPQTTNDRGNAYISGGVASSSGTDNTINFTLQLPITLNPRDPVGLILLQNEATQVTLTVDVGQPGDVYDNAANYTFALTSCSITPMIETFTVPALEEAKPDISVLKLVSSKAESFPGSGQNIVKLNVGTIYRKLFVMLEDADGAAFADADVTSNLELVFNQADIPYSIKPQLLTHKNSLDLGYTLPKGVYLFDFTNQGIPNLGGSRDYIDTERLTEFWVRFNSTKAGKVTVISENLTRLK